MYTSYKEYLNHPLFRKTCDSVKERSRGYCERCSGIAVDFHHIKYCKWGQFDPPENLEHLCRKCHDLAHRCTQCGGRTASLEIKLGTTLCSTCRQG